MSAERVALPHGRWTILESGVEGGTDRTESRNAGEAKRQPDGRWLFLIDNPLAPRKGRTIPPPSGEEGFREPSLTDEKNSSVREALRYGHGRGCVRVRLDVRVLGVFVKSLGDLLMKPAPHVERGRVNFFVMWYETNCAILHDVFQSMNVYSARVAPDRLFYKTRAGNYPPIAFSYESMATI